MSDSDIFHCTPPAHTHEGEALIDINSIQRTALHSAADAAALHGAGEVQTFGENVITALVKQIEEIIR